MKFKSLVLLVIVFIILMTNIPIFASLGFPDKPYDAYDYWVIYQHRDGDCILLSSKNPVLAWRDGTMLETTAMYRKYRLEYNNWVLSSTGDVNNHRNFVEIYASNHDIKYRGSSEVFFSARKATVLYPVMKTVDFGTLLRTIFRGLIPLVGLVILAISFRKGWEFLRRQLQH